MIESMRWFGSTDPVSLTDIRQTGAVGVVTAMHETPVEAAWEPRAVADRRREIESAGLSWTVVESIPVHDEIKRDGPDAERYTEIWIESLRAVAAAGVSTVCYNFMPVLDWTRTDLEHPVTGGATALRFDATAFAAFDLHILKREGAAAEYTDTRRAQAAACADQMDDAAVANLTLSVCASLPGGMSGSYDIEELREALARWRGVDHAKLLRSIVAFQSRVAPEAKRLGVALAIHPDDPPRSLLGLPRAVSTRSDFRTMFSETPNPANGLTWCLGSLSAGVVADVLPIGRDHADRIHFAHLRVVESDADDPESFQEAAHLGGDVSLIDAVELVLTEERRRGAPIPMRPDHGWRMLDDLRRSSNPGYGLLGRMRGLAELRGVAAALSRSAA